MASNVTDVLEEVKQASAAGDCSNFRRFKDDLQMLRKPEDNVSYQLARVRAGIKSDTKVSCKTLWRDLETIRAYRVAAISRCIKAKQSALEEVGKEGAEHNNVRDKARKDVVGAELSWLQSELVAENIMLLSTTQRFENACSSFK